VLPGRHLAEIFLHPKRVFSTSNCLFNFYCLTLVVSEILGGSKYIRGPCAPWTPLAKNVYLRRAFSIVSFALKCSPKWSFGMILGVGPKIFGWKVIYLQNFAFSGIFVLDLTLRVPVVPLCMGIAICHSQKFGQVWGAPAPLPEVSGNVRSQKAPLQTFDYHM